MAATLESVRKAVGKKGHSPAFAWLADLERQSGNLDGALMRVTDGLAFFPDNLAGLIVQSAIFFEKEQWENAGESCKDVLRKDPFCLSALRRLGDVNGKLGNIAERNFYYQRVHDLDPLDPFWSDTFNETVIEPVTSVALSENSASEDLIPQEMPELAPLEEAAPKLSLPPDLSKNEDDPFSSLSILLPAENENNSEISFDSLENSLNDALSGFGTEPTEKEYFPADDISGGEITSAFSGIFGPTEANLDSEPAPSSMFHIPTSLESEDTIESAPVEAVSAQEEDEPQSLSSAFDDIFGEDELPEEFVPLKPVTPVEDEFLNSDHSSAFEKSSDSEPVSAPEALVTEESQAIPEISPTVVPEPEILNIDDSSESLASLLAPLDKPVEAPIEERVEEPPVAPTATNFTEDVSSSLDALFGDSDDLEMPMAPLMPEEEIPPEANSLETEMKDAEDTLELPPKVVAESPLSAAVDSSFSALFGDDDDELLSPPLKAAVAESASPPVDTSFVKPEEKSTPSAEKKEMDEAISGAFDHLFNTSDDDLVDEKTLETENNVDGLMSSDEPSVSAEKKNVNLDERLNTRTLAEIYFEQGLFDEALSIYKDLAKKEPNNAEIAERLTVIEQKRSEKLDKV